MNVLMAWFCVFAALLEWNPLWAIASALFALKINCKEGKQ